MCLRYSKKKTARLRKRFEKQREIRFYKVLRDLGNDPPRSLYFYQYQWSPGLNKAEGVPAWVGGTLDGGALHVYRTLEKARKLMGFRASLCQTDAIYEVYGKLEDFVAAGDNNDAAFKAVWLGERVQ